MWPWEHLAFGYVIYALGRRGWNGQPPSNRAAIALAVGTQFPDLVDKPLAWVFDVLSSGTSMGHSLLVALPVTAVVIVFADRRGARAVGTAFSVGYLSHIAGDGLFFLLTSGTVSVDYMLWPLVTSPAGNDSLQAIVPRLWSSFVTFLGTPRGKVYLSLELALLALALGLWLWDGTPGIPRLREREHGA